MNIAVFGLGYVGMTAAACMTHEGHHVFGIDPSEEKVSIVNAGRSPIFEPGVEAMVKAAVEQGLLLASHDAGVHLNTCDMAIVCVGTPSAPDGSHNLGYIAEVSRQIGLIARHRNTTLTVVYRSTIRPGTIEEVIVPIFKECMQESFGLIELVYNPEFLREATAVDDFFRPAKIVIGTKDGLPCEKLNLLNQNLKAPTFYANYRESELTKFVDNTFHALKITFANEIGRLCLSLGIDAKKVHEIFVADTKLNISPYYLRPGGAFGGSCLPKDVRALQHISNDVGAQTHLINSVIRSNDSHKDFLFDSCVGDLRPGSRVLLIGLSFKANSDDLRESPNVDMARKLLRADYKVSIFDSVIDPTRLVGQNLGFAVSSLPTLRSLLVSREQMESQTYDLVIDTRGLASQLSLKTSRVIDINAI